MRPYPPRVRVISRAAEDLTPPDRDVRTVFLAHSAGEERAEQVVLFDAVVERIDQSGESIVAARPVIQCGHL
jgi:hypothetical protein